MLTAAARLIHHTPECAGPAVQEVTGRRGDPMARCRNCGRFVTLAEAAMRTPAPPSPTTPEASPVPEPRPARQAAPGPSIPPVRAGQRHGGLWPTHKFKARTQQRGTRHR